MSSAQFQERWRLREEDFNFLGTLLQSRSNCYLYGQNGCGKTTFVTDVLSLVEMPYIYIDCVEFPSEKLIATQLSLSLN